MRAIMVMFDTLCRGFLPPYGNDWVHAPNFRRLAARTAQFQNCYVGSMPCMPARRELHTGRYNFLHRSWGPLEPFDDSLPQLLSQAGVYTYLATDHYHYWEDGGATYHNRFDAYAFARGHEGDPYLGDARRSEPPPEWRNGRQGIRRTDWFNRQHQRSEAEQPQTLTFAAGLDFLRRHHDVDRWFCLIETFDPHEPFFTQRHYQDLYPHTWDGTTFDWPEYGRAGPARDSEHLQKMYAALLTMCDRNLGRVLDLMDEQGMWDDTLLIVNTDHGFLLGEHDHWGKCRMPFFQEVAHIPLFVWDPRSRIAGERREALVQTIDLAPTLLEFFGQPVPRDMMGVPLRATIERDAPVRQAALYGIHGGHVNVTDGRFVYMRGPVPGRNAPLAQYTVMPTHMRSLFAAAELQAWERHPGFAFTKGCPVMRIPCAAPGYFTGLETRLYDLATDYGQQRPIADDAVERRMTELLVAGLHAAEAPPEQYERLGLVGHRR